MSFLADWHKLFQRVGQSNFREFLEFIQSDYFYRDKLLAFFLNERNFENLPETDFIDYRRFLQYHPDEIMRVSIQYGDSLKHLRLPYKELIDFTKNPHVRIWVDGDVAPYEMPDYLQAFTQPALDSFLDRKPDTYDGPLVRLRDLRPTKDEYRCRLQSTSYYSQARTNLSLDYAHSWNEAVEWALPHLLDNPSAPVSLRNLDMTSDNRPRDFRDSLLVNTVGVSGVVCFRRGDDLFFFMKRRQERLGIFEDMFGAASGTGQYIPGLIVPELVSYAQREVLREFNRETGLVEEDSELVVRVVPLAFARELVRGGKPQFFFLIEIQDLSTSRFKEVFRKSARGLQEFYDDTLNNKATFRSALSPEFAVNLIYALRFFRAEQGLPTDPLVLPTW